MTPEQQAELRAQARANEACAEPLARRDLEELARILSIGRVCLVPRPITERGIRDVLGPVHGARFMRLLQELSAGAAEWLPGVLTAAGIPADEHADYADTFACAHSWVLDAAGLDIGTETVQQMLGLLAGAPGDYAASVEKLKDCAKVADPLTPLMVAEALYNPDGSER